MKQELEEMIRNYQVGKDNLYEMKKIKDDDEAENIFVMQNTVFIGTNVMQIKKLDGTIEKYHIEKYYPVDERDEQIKELHKKVEELERRLNDEHTKYDKSDSRGDKSSSDDDDSTKSNTETSS